MFKEIILPVLFWVLVVLAISAAMTGLWLWDFAGDCAAQGGTFSNEGGTAYCRY